MIYPELQDLPLREFISALERDGFCFRRGVGGHLQFQHTDGRQVTITFHRGDATLRRGTLRSALRAARWTDGDLRRLGLVWRSLSEHV